MTGATASLQLLRRWHRGDREALTELLRRHLPWIRAHVRDRLGPALRERAETADFVQDALLDFLEYGPRFELRDEAQLRALLARIVENNLRDAHKHYGRQRRDVRRERAFGEDSILSLDPVAPGLSPSQVAGRAERAEWLRLALELLADEDRQVLRLRVWEELEFPEIAQQLGLTESGARMRFQRALPKLAHRVAALRDGRLADVLARDLASQDG